MKLRLPTTHYPLPTNNGFSLIEALLAISIFALLAAAIIGGIVYGQESTALSGARFRAGLLAEEGIEAVRTMRDNTKTLPANTASSGLSISGNAWTFSGTQETVDSFFTRKISISTVDANTKKVTADISWQQNAQRTGSVIVDTYLSNWQTPTVKIGRTMMVYAKSGINTPFYRIWNGSTWSNESAATALGTGADIQYLILKFSRTRDEAVLGTLDSLGDIRVQVWNGTSWGSTTLVSNIGTTNDAYRGFDIEYETNGDRAIIVYNDANAIDPSARIWNGSSWTSANPITSPPTTGVPYWIELEANPLSSSNEIAMMLLDANVDTYGMAWNGSTWGTMGVGTVWDADCAIATKKVIDIAYEQTSGRAMFMWGDLTATDQYYRIWNGSTLTGATLLDVAASGGVANWIELASRPSSNEIMYGVHDAGADLNTRKWSGSAWDTATQHVEHDATTENITSNIFDITYETYSANSGKAWLLWGDGATVSAKQWSGTAWGTAAVLTGSDDTSFIRLHANPGSGAFFAGIFENTTSATDDISEWHLTGGSATWSTEMTVWGGPITAVEPLMSRIDMATERMQ